jgi:hypothetical protein
MIRRAPFALVTSLLLAATLLAGCSGGADDDPAAGEVPEPDFEDLDLQVTDDTGIIRGIVVDEAVRPLGGAIVSTVATDGRNRTTTSTPDGAFGLDGLEPGTYFLKVSKLGYRESQVSVDVVAGVREPPIVKVVLLVDPSEIPYVSAYQFDAFVACSFTMVLVSFAACGLVPEQTNNAFLVEYTVDKPPQWIQVEAIWESTQALGSALSLSVTDFSTGVQVGVNQTSGQSPIYVTVNETRAARFNYTGPDANPINIRLFSTAAPGTDLVPEQQIHQAWAASGYPAYNATGLDPVADGAFRTVGLANPLGESCIRWAVLFNACMGAGGVGVVLQQKVTVFTHVFYGYTPPVDWRFSNGGGAPDPPQ